MPPATNLSLSVHCVKANLPGCWSRWTPPQLSFFVPRRIRRNSASCAPSIRGWCIFLFAKTGHRRCCSWQANLCAGRKPCSSRARPKIKPRRNEQSRHAGPLHGGHEAQRKQCADLHAGKRRTAAFGARPALLQSLAQIKTIHSMALRINEIMQRFSSLASEMQEAENASQAETAEPQRPPPDAAKRPQKALQPAHLKAFNIKRHKGARTAKAGR